MSRWCWSAAESPSRPGQDRPSGAPAAPPVLRMSRCPSWRVDARTICCSGFLACQPACPVSPSTKEWPPQGWPLKASTSRIHVRILGRRVGLTIRGCRRPSTSATGSWRTCCAGNCASGTGPGTRGSSRPGNRSGIVITSSPSAPGGCARSSRRRLSGRASPGARQWRPASGPGHRRGRAPAARWQAARRATSPSAPVSAARRGCSGWHGRDVTAIVHARVVAGEPSQIRQAGSTRTPPRSPAAGTR